MRAFLEDILEDDEILYLEEAFDFSIAKDTKIEDLQEKISISDYLRTKLIRILFKLRLTLSELETFFENWSATEIHNIPMNYDSIPELLKNPKDYDRELKKSTDYVETMSTIRKLKNTIVSIEEKQDQLTNLQWKVKNIIDLEKIKHGLFL